MKSGDRGKKRPYGSENSEGDRPTTSANSSTSNFRPTTQPGTDFTHQNPHIQRLRDIDVFGAGRGFRASSDAGSSQQPSTHSTDQYDPSTASSSKRRRIDNPASDGDLEGSSSMGAITRGIETTSLLEPNERTELQNRVMENSEILRVIYHYNPELREDHSEKIIALIDSTIPDINRLLDSTRLEIAQHNRRIESMDQKKRLLDQIIDPIRKQNEQWEREKNALRTNELADWGEKTSEHIQTILKRISDQETAIKPQEEEKLNIEKSGNETRTQVSKAQNDEASLSSLLTSMQTIREDVEESPTYHDIKAFDTFLQTQGERLLQVSGRGMNCMIRALLRSAAHPLNSQFEQMVQETRDFANRNGITAPGDLITIDEDDGQAIIGYLRSRGFLDSRRGITVYALDQGEVSGRPVTEGTNPNLDDNYFVCLDIAGIHFYGVDNSQQIPQDSAPDTPPASHSKDTAQNIEQLCNTILSLIEKKKQIRLPIDEKNLPLIIKKLKSQQTETTHLPETYKKAITAMQNKIKKLNLKTKLNKKGTTIIEERNEQAKEKGFKNRYDMLNAQAKEKGFKNHTDMQNSQAQEKGFKNRHDMRNEQAKEKGFKNRHDMLNAQAKEKGFKNHSDMRNSQAKEKGFKNHTDMQNSQAQEKGFKNRHDMRNEQAKEKGFKNRHDMLNAQAKEKGFKNHSDMRNSQAKEKGFKNYSDMRNEQAKEKGFKNRYDMLNAQAKEKGFKNYSDMRNAQAKEKGFKNRHDMRNAQAKEKGFKNYSDMLNAQAQEKGLKLDTGQLEDFIGLLETQTTLNTALREQTPPQANESSNQQENPLLAQHLEAQIARLAAEIEDHTLFDLYINQDIFDDED